MIQWLSGSLAAGLLLASVPLIIHLISRRRARDVYFPALALVMRSKKRTARTVRLQKLLLLLLRTLLILLAALAVLQPVWQKVLELDTPRYGEVALVLDVSASMRAVSAGQSALEAASSKLRERLSDIAEDTPVSLWRCGTSPRVLVPRGFDRPAIVRALDAEAAMPLTEAGALAPCIAAASAGDATGSAADDDDAPDVLVLVFSDLAAHALARNGEATKGARASTAVEYVTAHDAPPGNVGVGRIRLAPLFDGGQRVDFAVAGRSNDEQELAVDLFRGDARVARAQVQSGPEGASSGRLSATAPLAAAPESDEGVEDALTLAIETEDAIVDDNAVTFPVAAKETVRVLLLDGAPAQVPHQDEVFYLEAALSKQRAERVRIATVVRAPEQANPADLADVRAVIVANVARLPDRMVPALIEFTTAGGGLLITSGDRVDATWMNAALGEVLAGTLRGAKTHGGFDGAAQALGLKRPAGAHPLFDALTDDGAGTLLGLARVRTTTSMLLEPGTERPRATLLTFTDGSPALTERRVGRGRALLWLTSADRDWSDMCIRPGFLPLVQELIAYAAGVQRAPQAPFATVHETRTLVLPEGLTSVTSEDPTGARRVLSAAPESGGTGASATIDMVPVHVGMYRFFTDDERALPLAALRFTAQTAPEESDLRLAPEAQRQAALPQGAKQTSRSDDGRTPLWPFALLLLPILFLAESALGYRARPQRPGKARRGPQRRGLFARS